MCNTNKFIPNEANKCLICPSHCIYCHFDDNNIFYCDSCDENYVLNEAKLCEACSNNIQIGGEGCVNCRYEGGRNKCLRCRSDYIFIENDYVCKLPSEINLNVTCEKAKRINNEYSCTKCRRGNYTLMTRYNNTNDCYNSTNEIINCYSGYEDKDGNLSCTYCRYNYRFVWSEKYKLNICDDKCAYDYFFNYNADKEGCQKCDDPNGGGQIGCNATEGCSYNLVDNHFYCNSCKIGYFLYDWQCGLCSRFDNNCLQCHFNTSEKNATCDQCKEEYYINKAGGCSLITYDEYPEITPGCILPVHNSTLYKEKNKCFDCKYGFFKHMMKHVYIVKLEKMEVQNVINANIY